MRAEFLARAFEKLDFEVKEKAIKRAKFQPPKTSDPREPQEDEVCPRIKFGPPCNVTRVAFCTDSQVNAAWLNGESVAKADGYSRLSSYLHKLLAEAQRNATIRTPCIAADWAFWIPRTMNTEADSLANRCLDEGDIVRVLPAALERWPWIVISSDGASRGNPGESAMAWIAKGSKGPGKRWYLLAQAGLRLGTGNSMRAEAAAFAHAIWAATQLAKQSLTEDDVKVFPSLRP
jgi:ribonuclease HI